MQTMKSVHANTDVAIAFQPANMTQTNLAFYLCSQEDVRCKKKYVVNSLFLPQSNKTYSFH